MWTDRRKMLFGKALSMETMLDGRYVHVVLFGYTTQTIDPLLSYLSIGCSYLQCVTRCACYHKCSRIFAARLNHSTGQMLLLWILKKVFAYFYLGRHCGRWMGISISINTYLPSWCCSDSICGWCVAEYTVRWAIKIRRTTATTTRRCVRIIRW